MIKEKCTKNITEQQSVKLLQESRKLKIVYGKTFLNMAASSMLVFPEITQRTHFQQYTCTI